jgi:hypothetical protein
VVAYGLLAADAKPTPLNARAAVQRSLPFIEKAGTDWMREQKCNSCHAVTFLVWSHNEAAAHGLEVDPKKLADWTAWSLADALSDQHWFGLRVRALETLKADGLPETLLAKLRPLISGKNYVKPQLFLDAMEKVIGAEELARWKGNLLRAAALPNNGGGPDTLAQLLLGRSPASGDKFAKDYDAVRSLLMEWQEPDGSWQTQGQLPELKWAGEKEMNEATTLWCALAASAALPQNDALVRSRELALAALKNSGPGATLQSLALHLIVARKFGEAAQAERLHGDLLKRQNSDGGWGWVKENPGSDAFATGQALYVLGLTGRDGNDPRVRRAWEFLLRTQGVDGGWDVPQSAINRRPRKLNVYPCWGTAWAAIGILHTLPK